MNKSCILLPHDHGAGSARSAESESVQRLRLHGMTGCKITGVLRKRLPHKTPAISSQRWPTHPHRPPPPSLDQPRTRSPQPALRLTMLSNRSETRTSVSSPIAAFLHPRLASRGQQGAFLWPTVVISVAISRNGEDWCEMVDAGIEEYRCRYMEVRDCEDGAVEGMVRAVFLAMSQVRHQPSA